MTTAGTPQPNWDTPAELGQPAAKLGQPGRVGRPMQGWDDPVKWDSLPQGGMARSWDTPAKLGQPSQTGTTQPNWDSPTAWDVPHRVGRPNRLGCPMQMWDDSVVDHPTTSLGHTTQAGTWSHTNWADPIFSRLLSSVLRLYANLVTVRGIPTRYSATRHRGGTGRTELGSNKHGIGSVPNGPKPSTGP